MKKKIQLFILCLYPLIPLISSLLGMIKFRNKLGAISFILFGICLNSSLLFLPNDDITRYIDGYILFRQGYDWIGTVDLYYWITCFFFRGLNLPPYFILIGWTIMYYLFFYLCLRKLHEYIIPNKIVSVLFFISSLFFINIIQFSSLRFYTAAFCFIYFLFVLEGKETKPTWRKKSIMLILPYIHFMYFPIVLYYYLYSFFRPSLGFLAKAVVITYIFSFMDIGEALGHFAPFLIKQESISYYTGSRVEQMNASYNYGKYLYVPMMLSVLYFLYIQIEDFYKNKQVNIHYNMLSCILSFWSFYNIISVSWDFQMRFRTIVQFLSIYPILYFMNKKYDVRFEYYKILFPFAFLFSNYDFFFVSASIFFDFNSLFFDFNSLCNLCISRINKI